jgi:16S rRNA (guanine966-N2)-methyltransferase
MILFPAMRSPVYGLSDWHGSLTILRMASNQVRIIGGKWRGRKLAFPDAATLRPTLGRVRETLFNWLAGRIAGACCLDLYAGTGALGFEALSRGAAEADMVERARTAVAALRRNAQLLQAPARVHGIPAERFLQATDRTWDVIFLDPPFADDALPRALEVIAERGLLRPGGCVYFEQAERGGEEPAGPGWRLLKKSRAGASEFGLLVRD